MAREKKEKLKQPERSSAMATELMFPERIVWDTTHKKQVEEAKQVIMARKREGYVITLSNGQPMEKYSPMLGEVIILPKKIGGHVMKILSDKGDERLVWDKEDGRQAMECKSKFKELIDKGYSAYTTTESGKRKSRITEFDVDAQEVLMIPPTVKG